MARLTAPTAHLPDATRVGADLAELRPELRERFDAALPGARAAVLGRLLGALDREPLPGVVKRQPGRARLVDGTGIHYPAAGAAPFALPDAGLSVHLDGPARAAVTDPGELARRLWPASPFAAELDNSVANLALARAAAVTTEPSLGSLADVEQRVIDGHPLHPCCRTRAGMSTTDVLAYAPEHRPVFPLRRLRVPDDRWYGTAPPVLYAHPWQAARLRDTYPWLTDAGETGPVRPLMSLRTVAPIDGGDHIKTAVDVQMTSAVRTVSPAAVHNGPRLSALLAALTVDLPLGVLAETAAGAVLVDGEPQRHLAHLIRRAPQLGPGETVLPLAAVDQMTVADPYAWFAALAEILWTPLMQVLDRGVALEAHGQNTLLVLRDGRPHRILYRDLGGVRVSGRRLRAAGFDAPALRGDLPCDDPALLRTKLAAAAISTVAGQLIALFAGRGANPGRLWALVAAAIRAADTPDGQALLRDPLPIKATTAMRLAADPLTDQWATIDNPMAAYG